MVEVEICIWIALCSVHTTKIEGKILQDRDYTSYDLWSKMFANQEATYAQNEYRNRKDRIRN